MFPDSFWFNFAVFLIAQGAAYGYLRTGILWRGVLLVLVSWIAADVALVLRFAFDDTGAAYYWALLVLQVHTFVESLLLVIGRVRHHSPGLQERRDREFRTAVRSYLQNRLEGAAQGYRALARRDPWDLESALGWGTVLCRQGEFRRAQWQFVRARWLDRDKKFQDVIAAELARCRGATAAPRAVAGRSAPKAKASPEAPPTKVDSAKPAQVRSPNPRATKGRDPRAPATGGSPQRGRPAKGREAAKSAAKKGR